MSEIYKLAFLVILSATLIIYGLIAIKRRHVSIGFGRPPLFYVPLDGTGATVFGVVSILGGIITLIPTIMFFSSRDDATLETAMTVGIATGLIIVSGGFGAGLLTQFIKNLEERSAANRKEN